MTDVAIIGIGIHPFGRHDGVSAMDMGVYAARQACATRAWTGATCSSRGRRAAGQRRPSPTRMVGRLGLTGVPLRQRLQRLRDGRHRAAPWRCNAIEAGMYDNALVVGFDKHPRGAFDPDPRILGLGQWYGDIGMMLTTQFFAMKINRYMHDFGISESTLAKVAAKNFRNGVAQPERVAAEADERGGDRSRRGCSTTR